MSKSIKLFLFLFYTTSVFAAESFIRTTNNGDLEFAIRTYKNDNGIEAVLIPTIHFAEPEFYQRINLLQKDKPIIYEAMGLMSMEITKKLYEAIEGLSKEDQELFKLVEMIVDNHRTIAAAFNLIHQSNGIKYDLASELILGDSCEENDKANSIIENGLKKFLDETVQKFGEEKCMREYLEQKRQSIANLNLGFIVNENSKKFDAEEVKKRNPYIYSAIGELLARDIIPPSFIINYGTAHMPGIHDYLVSKGFTLQLEIAWNKAFNTNKRYLKEI